MGCIYQRLCVYKYDLPTEKMFLGIFLISGLKTTHINNLNIDSVPRQQEELFSSE